VIAIAGGKGGCGKTTTTVALARALARRRDATPLVADADWDMPNLHALAGAASTPSLAALGDAASPRTVAQFVGDPPIGVLPAPTGETEARQDRTLRTVRDRSGRTPVLVDCPAGAGRDAARPLRVADGVVLVSTAAPASLRDAAKTAAMAETLGTPILAAAVTRTQTVPEGARRLLGIDRIISIPEAGAPLDDLGVRRASADLAELVDRSSTHAPVG